MVIYVCENHSTQDSKCIMSLTWRAIVPQGWDIVGLILWMTLLGSWIHGWVKCWEWSGYLWPVVHGCMLSMQSWSRCALVKASQVWIARVNWWPCWGLIGHIYTAVLNDQFQSVDYMRFFFFLTTSLDLVKVTHMRYLYLHYAPGETT